MFSLSSFSLSLIFFFSHFLFLSFSSSLLLFFYLLLPERNYMNILVIGSGGREHALAWKIAQSPKLTKLFILPGNGGTGSLGENVSGVSMDDHPALIRFCEKKKIDLVIVGPEAPLADGVADALSTAGIRCFGPRKAAAQIEASKVFAKNFMARHRIPTARYQIFTNYDEALAFVQSVDYPIVIKASGLASGKGVVLPESFKEAEETLRSMLVRKEFKNAGLEVVIEERLEGPEVSLMAFTDGTTIVPMLPAQDHKRLLDGDQGPNTGGMGAYAPAPICTAEMSADVQRTILQPVIDGMREEGYPFVGVLFAGLILTSDGPKVLEFNCRFGDPETQAVLPLLESDLVEVIEACVNGALDQTEVHWKSGASVCVVIASGGYPVKLVYGKLSKGSRSKIESGVCFHAGTRLEGGRIITSGGRVFGVTAWDESIEKAIPRVYAAVEKISFDDMQYRKDIAWRALQTDARTDDETEKRIAEPSVAYRVSKLVKLPTDELTYKVNGLAMQVHNEIGPGHAEKFYHRRLAELCKDAGLAVETEKRVEVVINHKMVGYLKLDLWIDEQLIVECKSLHRQTGNEEVGQVLTYLAATASPVGMLYNFGHVRLETRRILAASEVREWQKHLYRFIHRAPGMILPPLNEKSNVPPIRFNSINATTKLVEIPSPTGAAIRLSASKSVSQSAYDLSGVSIDAGNRAVDLMKDAVKSTYTKSVLAGIGSFGGLFDASALQKMNHPVLVASTDGVGTKVKLAASIGRYRGIGHDIVNHCINDILVQGARPLFFMDYFATSKLNPEQTADVVTGIAEACKDAGMALLGGETAEMPGVYRDGEFDVAGTIVGALERDDILPRNLHAGDVLIGLASSGPHTNGYSLIRKIFADTPLDQVFPELGCSLADALLAPHRSYLNLISNALRNPHVHALAHLTGGGFIENIPRVLPDDLDAVIHLNSWTIPPLWKLIQQKGNIAAEEMFRVFNMGIGMVVIVDKSAVAKIQKMIPEETFIIGDLVKGERKTRLLI
jgi:phosphoribosylamine--glycine ligase/phosphoribosylaminoimidazole synthetase